MCGRSSLTKNEKEIEERFHATFYSEDLERYNPLPNFNVAPSQFHPVITNNNPTKLNLFKWGLIPSWAKDPKMGFKMINARVETLGEKPSFKGALESRRCLVPFDGYYEWKKTSIGKQPFRIVTKNIDIFTVAGLWEKWTPENGEVIFSFTLITQSASDSIAHIHDRMPAILNPADERIWIESDISSSEALKIIQPYPDHWLHYYPVSTWVNKVSANDPSLIEEIPPFEQEQLSLFN